MRRIPLIVISALFTLNLQAKLISEPRTEVKIYLGTVTQDQKTIPQKEWESFFEKHISSIGPGLTLEYGQGYWTDAAAKLQTERSLILTILAPEDNELEDRVQKFAETFAVEFKQFAVSYTLQTVQYRRYITDHKP